MKPTGFYNTVEQYGFQKLGFCWRDNAGNYHKLEAAYVETDPIIIADFLDMFQRALRAKSKQ